jgi:hypothetical protein
MSTPQQSSGFSYQIPPRATIKNVSAATYTITAADFGIILNYTGTVNATWRLPLAASLGSGFNVYVWNTTTSTTPSVAIATTGSDTFEGATSISLARGMGLQVLSNGTGWRSGSGKALKMFSENSDVNSSRATTTGLNSIAIGSGANASATASLAIGQSSTANGLGSTALGGCTVNGQYSFGIGQGGNDNGVYGMLCSGGVSLGNLGQWAITGLSAATTNATATLLCTDGTGTASSLNQLTLSVGSAIAFSIYVVARQQQAGGSQSAAWKIEGLIRQEATAAATVLVASTVTAISNVPGWTMAVAADTTNGAIKLTATGAASTNITWLATAITTQLVYQ